MELSIYEIFSMGRSLLCSRQVALTNIIYGMPVQEEEGESFSVYMDGLGVMHWKANRSREESNWDQELLFRV